MPVYTDQLQRKVSVDVLPKRIVSLVPSQTELLSYLGLEQEVAGITRFCVHPASWFRSKTRIGGTKDLHIDQIGRLKPDLILANKEENNREQIESLAALAPVWVSDVNRLEDALQMIGSIGQLTGKNREAGILMEKINRLFISLQQRAATEKNIRTAYLIWKDPYMTVGGDTFIHDMMRYAGMENVFADAGRYPITSPAEILAKGAELVVLSSEPYPFKQKHLEDLQQALPTVKIALVNGEMFSWYGSRLLQAASYFNQLRDVYPGQ